MGPDTLDRDVVVVEVEKTDQEIREERAALSHEYFEAKRAGRDFQPREISPTKQIKRYKSKYDGSLYNTLHAALEADAYCASRIERERTDKLMEWIYSDSSRRIEDRF